MSTEAGTAAGAAGGPTLRRSLAIQARVIHALLLRELITRFGRRNLGALWLVVEPAMFTMAVAGLWGAAGFNRSSSLPIVACAITGYSSVLLWRNTTSHAVNAIRFNFSLLFHRNVRVLDVFAARILLEIAGASASFMVLASLAVLFGQMAPPEDALTVLAGWLLLCWFGAALALAVGAASAFSELVPRIWQPVSYVLFPLSGAAFMVSALPPAAQEVVLWLPMVHAVELVRHGYFGRVVDTRFDVGFLATSNLLLTFAGLVLVRLASRRVEAQ